MSNFFEASEDLNPSGTDSLACSTAASERMTGEIFGKNNINPGGCTTPPPFTEKTPTTPPGGCFPRLEHLDLPTVLIEPPIEKRDTNPHGHPPIPDLDGRTVRNEPPIEKPDTNPHGHPPIPDPDGRTVRNEPPVESRKYDFSRKVCGPVLGLPSNGPILRPDIPQQIPPSERTEFPPIGNLPGGPRQIPPSERTEFPPMGKLPGGPRQIPPSERTELPPIGNLPGGPRQIPPSERTVIASDPERDHVNKIVPAVEYLCEGIVPTHLQKEEHRTLPPDTNISGIDNRDSLNTTNRQSDRTIPQGGEFSGSRVPEEFNSGTTKGQHRTFPGILKERF